MDKSYIQLKKEGSVQRYGASIFVRPQTKEAEFGKTFDKLPERSGAHTSEMTYR